MVFQGLRAPGGIPRPCTHGRRMRTGLLMAVPTLAIGLLPTYASMGILAPLLLLLMRVLQGAAIGGEVPGAWVFVAEQVPARRSGIA